jgi:hypothetical protein
MILILIFSIHFVFSEKESFNIHIPIGSDIIFLSCIGSHLRFPINMVKNNQYIYRLHEPKQCMNISVSILYSLNGQILGELLPSLSILQSVSICYPSFSFKQSMTGMMCEMNEHVEIQICTC